MVLARRKDTLCPSSSRGKRVGENIPYIFTLWHSVHFHFTKRENLVCSRDNDDHKSTGHAATFTVECKGFTCVDMGD